MYCAHVWTCTCYMGMHMHLLHGHAHALVTWACTCTCYMHTCTCMCAPALYVCMPRSYAAHRARHLVRHARRLAEAAAAAAAPPRCLGVIHSGGWAVIGGGLVRLPAAPPRCLPWPYRPTIYIYIYRGPTGRRCVPPPQYSMLPAYVLTSHTLAHLLALLAYSTLALHLLYTYSALALHLLYTCSLLWQHLPAASSRPKMSPSSISTAAATSAASLPTS